MSLPEGTQQFEYHLDKGFFEAMESADVRDAELTVRLEVTRRGDIYDMRFYIEGNVTVGCDRCLDDLVMPVDADYSVAVKYGDAYNDEADEVIEIPAGERYFDISRLVYDTVMLSLPMTCVHPAGACNPAMSSILEDHSATIADGDDDATADTEIDPRWSELKKLTDNN